ncbi:MAG: helix-hairpin-helix domain-containing protein, partial [Akkermansiaceae bacterium]|nr:helix-hairpin-helix domain-containing protein [Akkermansiaceae bacterium]
MASLSGVGPVSEASDKTQDRLDLNRATVQELISLPGIGEATAKRIVEFREQHGPFQRVEDLMKVKGIGEKSFQKLRPLVKVTRV